MNKIMAVAAVFVLVAMVCLARGAGGASHDSFSAEKDDNVVRLVIEACEQASGTSTIALQQMCSALDGQVDLAELPSEATSSNDQLYIERRRRADSTTPTAATNATTITPSSTATTATTRTTEFDRVAACLIGCFQTNWKDVQAFQDLLRQASISIGFVFHCSARLNVLDTVECTDRIQNSRSFAILTNQLAENIPPIIASVTTILHLSAVKLSDDFVAPLTKHKWPRLQALHLSTDRVSPPFTLFDDTSLFPVLDVLDMTPSRNLEGQLTHLLRAPPSVTFLSLARNNLLQLPYLGPKVRWLGLQANRLAKLTIADQKALLSVTQLDLTGNVLTELSLDTLEHFPSLENLTLAGNRVLAFPDLSHNKALVSLDLTDNFLKDTALMARLNHSNLKVLALSGNYFTELKPTFFVGTPNLEELRLSTGFLKTVVENTFDRLSQLRILDMSDNVIESLPDGLLRHLEALEDLDLSNNRHLQRVDPDLVQLNKRLKRLVMANTAIDRLPVNLLESNPALEFLDLRRNDISELKPSFFKYTTELRTLVLSFNPLRQLDPGLFQPLTQLVTLRLASTSVESVPAVSCNALEVLDVSNSRITALPRFAYECSNLRVLAVSNTSIPKLEVEKLASCTKLDVLSAFGVPLSLPADSLNLDMFSLGWKGLTEDVISSKQLCHHLTANAEILELDGTGYTSLSLNCNVEFVRCVNNEKLVHFDTTSEHLRFLSLVDNPELTTFNAPPNIDHVDISNTNMQFQPLACISFGTQEFIARHVPWNSHGPALLDACVRADTSFVDLRDNAWLNDMALLSDTLGVRRILGPEAVYEDLFSTQRFFSVPSITTIDLSSASIPVTCDADVHSRLVLLGDGTEARMPAFSYVCKCLPAFHRDEETNKCVRTLGAMQKPWVVVAVVLVCVLSSFAIYAGIKYLVKRDRKQKHDLSLHKNLLEDAHNEVLALRRVWEIDEEEIDRIKRIDEATPGAFGEVWLANWDHIQVAVKILKANMMELDETTTDDFGREIEFLMRTRHPNLVRFFGAGTTSQSAPFVVLEFVARGSLMGLLAEGLDGVVQRESPQTPTVDVKLVIARDIACGMQFLHSTNAFHRDLKSANVLVTSQFRAKISDFGTIRLALKQRQYVPPRAIDVSFDGSYHSGMMTPVTGQLVGTPMYMSPEVLDGQAYSASCDVWSYGIILWELWSEQPPDLIQQVRGSEKQVVDACGMLSQLLRDGHRLSFDVKSSSSEALGIWFQELAQQCVDEDPKSRPSFNTVFSIFDAKMNQLTFRNLRLSTSAGNFGKN
eukprot:m.275540 g.275540  ORF g.275540 m.275540 type:complete len:1289 (+) comp15697_c1_seq6:223-4089(+)